MASLSGYEYGQHVFAIPFNHQGVNAIRIYHIYRSSISSGGSRKLGTGGGAATGGGRLRQNQVLAVCTERSTGKSPPPLPYRYGPERGGRPPPLNPRLIRYPYRTLYREGVQYLSLFKPSLRIIHLGRQRSSV